MIGFLSRHKETILFCLFGLLIFGCLNVLMLQMNPDTWTDPSLRAYSMFHNGWELSGFDNTIYMTVTEWRPMFTIMRHPLIMYFIWPLYQLNALLSSCFGINCTIYIVAVVWTVISTVAWLMMYKILRRIMELPILVSLLLTLFFFSFSHIMLCTFAPDHMVLSMMLFLLAIYISTKAIKKGRQMSTWKALLLCFFATGITTTNFVKIWFIDVMGMQGTLKLKSRKWWRRFIMHGLLYLLPLLVVGGLYYYQQQTIVAKEIRYVERLQDEIKRKYPEIYAQQQARARKVQTENEAKQLSGSKMFQWTDFSLPLWPSVVENFFGESLQLHDEYTLRDCHCEGHRPDIVAYSHWYNYLVEALIVLLLAVGIWCGRKERLMWMLMAIFGFDCLLHLGLRFALDDVYIMAPHWAFIIPIATGYAYLRVKDNKLLRNSLLTIVTCLTVWLWFHNLSLTADFIINAPKV